MSKFICIDLTKARIWEKAKPQQNKEFVHTKVSRVGNISLCCIKGNNNNKKDYRD